MVEDIRQKAVLTHEDILNLNFIRSPGGHFFRRHYRVGLRSHILEVIKIEDLVKEREGISLDGFRWFPRSKPFRMLRIFRTRFDNFRAAEAEMERVKLISHYLGKSRMAVSQEFVVDYRTDDLTDLLLCGLQEYVEGEILDPWSSLNEKSLLILLKRMTSDPHERPEIDAEKWINRLRINLQSFCDAVKKMIVEAGYIPDLAGVGNLMISCKGDIKLVDINNISEVHFDPEVYLDDKGYPVCDKSIQALARLERKPIGRDAVQSDTLYKHFLNPIRIKTVEFLEREFHSLAAYKSSYPASGV